MQCTAERPICSLCSRRGTECSYQSLEAETRYQAIQRRLREQDDELHKYKVLYWFLRTHDPEEAKAVLERIRAGDTLDSVTRAITEGGSNVHASPRLSNHLATRGLLPRTSSELEYELTTLHQMAYPILLPIDATTLEFSPSKRPSSFSVSLSERDSSAPRRQGLAERLSTRLIWGQTTPVILDTPDPHELCDARLKRLSISYWTKVPISDESAAVLISIFLRTEQSIIGFFDTDLFIADLVSHSPRYCSSFLVNSVLFVACQAYTASDLRAATLAQAFFEMSHNLFRLEILLGDVPTLAAVNIFSLGCLFRGNDRLGHELLGTARRMGRRMNLYGIEPNTEDADKFRQLPHDQIRAIAHVAWGTYNWLTLHALYYHAEPIDTPPTLPIPGTEESVAGWPPHPLPRYMGRSFTITCEFLTIVQEVALHYFSHDTGPVSDRVHLSFAEEKYQKLLSWSDTLSEELAWDENSPGHLIIFHMWFHSAVLDIFRPFLQAEKYHDLASFASRDSSPQAAFAASVNQLKRLAVIYCSRHMSTTYMPYVNGSLVHIADTVLKDRTDPSWKYYFMLCIRCWQQLYIGLPIFGDIARASLSMATKSDLITKAEANILLAELQVLGGHHRLARGAVTTSIIVDYDLAMTNRDEARVRALAMKFEDMGLFG